MSPIGDVDGDGEPARAAALPVASETPIGKAAIRLLRGLDRLCREVHERAVELLGDDDHLTLESSEPVRFAVYRCLREFRRREREIRTGFVQRMARRIDAPHGTASPDLAALSAAALEHEVLCTVLVARVRAETASLLRALACAWPAVACDEKHGGSAIADALGPRAVLDAYFEAIGTLGPEPELRLWLLRAMHAQMLRDLPALYRACLEDIGHAPPACDAAASRDATTALLPLLAGRGGDAMEQASTWTRAQLCEALATLSEQGGGAPRPDPAAGLEAVLLAAGPDSPQRLSEADRAICDLAGMVSEAMLDDPDSPPERRADVARWQFALLRLGLGERATLLRPGHPVRTLIEAWLRLAARSEAAPDAASFLQGCRDLVRSAMEGFEGDRRFADPAVPPTPAPDAPHAAASGDTPIDTPPGVLAIGAWVDFRAGNAAPQRLKLCWRGGFSGMHVFVDRAGVKALEVSEGELRTLLRRGHLRPAPPAFAAAEPGHLDAGGLWR